MCGFVHNSCGGEPARNCIGKLGGIDEAWPWVNTFELCCLDDALVVATQISFAYHLEPRK